MDYILTSFPHSHIFQDRNKNAQCSLALRSETVPAGISFLNALNMNTRHQNGKNSVTAFHAGAGDMCH